MISTCFGIGEAEVEKNRIINICDISLLLISSCAIWSQNEPDLHGSEQILFNFSEFLFFIIKLSQIWQTIVQIWDAIFLVKVFPCQSAAHSGQLSKYTAGGYKWLTPEYWWHDIFFWQIYCGYIFFFGNYTAGIYFEFWANTAGGNKGLTLEYWWHGNLLCDTWLFVTFRIHYSRSLVPFFL